MLADCAKFFIGLFQNFYEVGVLLQPVSDDMLAWSRSVAMQASLKATLVAAQAFAITDFRLSAGVYSANLGCPWDSG